MEVYSKLYDVVDERMKENNQELEYSKNSFMAGVNHLPGEFDCIDLVDADNKEFYTDVYICLLNRLPDPSANKTWGSKTSYPIIDFRKEVLNGLLVSEEKIIKGSLFKNNRVIPLKEHQLHCLNQSVETIYLKNGYGNSKKTSGGSKKESQISSNEVHENVPANTERPRRKNIIDYAYSAYLKLPAGLRLRIHKMRHKEE